MVGAGRDDHGVSLDLLYPDSDLCRDPCARDHPSEPAESGWQPGGMVLDVRLRSEFQEAG